MIRSGALSNRECCYYFLAKFFKSMRVSTLNSIFYECKRQSGNESYHSGVHAHPPFDSENKLTSSKKTINLPYAKKMTSYFDIFPSLKTRNELLIGCMKTSRCQHIYNEIVTPHSIQVQGRLEELYQH